MKWKFTFLTLSIVSLYFIMAGFKTKEDDLSWPVINQETKPWTRWWWMGNAVDKTNLLYNLGELQRTGFGGVEITPIYGVKGNDNKNIPFLSPQWMDMLKYTIAEANRMGMKVDMNTGTGWPFGGPQISQREAACKVFFRNYQLTSGQKLAEPVVINDSKQKDAAVLSCLMAYSQQGLKVNLTSNVQGDGTLNWTAPEGNWKLIALFVGKTFQTVKRAAPGGEGWVMNHFSKDALDVYLSRFSKAFSETGCPYPHTFFNDSYEVFGADWTPSFLEEFYKHRGYRLEDYFPEFLSDEKSDVTARLKSDYRETMSEILLENFSRPWTDWAHSKGAITRNQAHGSPANLIDVYAAPDIPECETFGSTPFDIPGLRRDPADVRQGDADPMMLKFSSSAAHVTGKKYVSSETFTWLGEHFKVALSQCKPELDQLFLSGINHVYFHGTTYSPKEAMWPGWLFYASCEFSFNNTIWRDMEGLTGYISRCQSFLQAGKPDNDVLVYWPVYDLWSNPKGMDMPLKIHDLQQWLHPGKFYHTISWLRNQGLDFDYISDHLLDNAETENGNLILPGGAYKVLVVPECSYMPAKTLQKIASLADNGAKVVFIGSLPGDVPGLSNLETNRREIAKIRQNLRTITPLQDNTNIVVDRGKVVVTDLFPGLFAKMGVQSEQATEKGIGFIRRKCEEGNIYFFANQQAKSFSGWLKLAAGVQSAAIFDPITGNSGVAAVRNENNDSEIFLQLEPDESVIVKTWNAKKISGKIWEYYQPAGKPIEIKGMWKLSMMEGVPQIKHDFELDTLTSWTNLSYPDLKIFAGTGKYSLKFVLPEKKADNWQLDLGKIGESARVKINGNDVGIWWAIPFRKNIGAYLKKGENMLEIEVSNLAANRIADLDRKGVEWRIFNEINFVDLNYKPFLTSSWKTMESGLLGPVTLIPMKKLPKQ